MSNATAEPDETAPSIETRKLGRYSLRYRVAQGGMASVYLAQLATAEGFRKWVAVKTVHPHIAHSPRFVQMFLDEARLAARIDHPNVCGVFDFGEADGTWFLAMEYLHGESLSSVARRAFKEKGFPLEIAVRVIADAARGLHAAHELRTDDGTPAGVVHRDVSPQNVFVLYTGVAKVVDFGIARSEERSGELTRTGELKGKVAYMSPEQVDQAQVDRRADIWALGVVLWECTVGQRLFKRANEARTLAAVLQDRVPLPRERRPDFPPELEAIVMGALDRDLDKRTPTALQLARSLEAFLTKRGAPTGADEVGEFMRGLFADKISMREELLRRDRDDFAIEVIESASDSLSVAPSDLEAAMQRGASQALPVAPVAPAATAAAAPERPRRTKLLVALAVLMLLLGAIPGAYFATRPAGDAIVATSLAPAHQAPQVPALANAIAAPPEAPAVALPEAPVVAPEGPVPAPEAPVVAPVVVAPAAPIAVAPRASPEPRRGGTRRPTVPTTVAPVDPPPPTEPARPFVRRGYLNLNATPGCQVFDGTQSLGRTPLVDLALPAGPHRLRCVTAGEPDRTVNVVIIAGATAVVGLRSTTQAP